jgi:hypothetical protein
VAGSIRLTPARWEKLRRLGTGWLAKAIDRARLSSEPLEPPSIEALMERVRCAEGRLSSAIEHERFDSTPRTRADLKEAKKDLEALRGQLQQAEDEQQTR